MSRSTKSVSQQVRELEQSREAAVDLARTIIATLRVNLKRGDLTCTKLSGTTQFERRVNGWEVMANELETL